MKVFVQDNSDAKELENAGFQNVETLEEDTIFEDIKLSKTTDQHGRGEVLKFTDNMWHCFQTS